MSYGVLTNSSIEAYFRQTTISPYQEMKHNLQNVRDNLEGIQRVLNSTNQKYAYIGDAAMLNYAKSRNCNLSTVGNFKEDSFGLALPKQSLYWKEINLQILKLREDGFLDKLEAIWYHNRLDINHHIRLIASLHYHLKNINSLFLFTKVSGNLQDRI